MKLNYFAVFLLVIFSLNSCKKIDHHIPNPVNQVDIYIAGNKEHDKNAFVIKNGEYYFIEIDNLPNDKILLNDFDIVNGKPIATYTYSEPNSKGMYGSYTLDYQVKYVDQQYSKSLKNIAVNNNDYYIAGNKENTDETFVLKNGRTFKNYNNPYFHRFFTNGKDFLFANVNGNNYYKNEVATNYEKKGDYTILIDLVLHQNKDYAVGYYVQNASTQLKLIGCFWINGKMYELPNTDLHQMGLNVAFDKNDMIVVASESDFLSTSYRYICYYRNGKRHVLPGDYYSFTYHDMQVYNGDVYILVAVSENGEWVAKVYKNEKVIASYSLEGINYYQNLILKIGKK